MASYDIGVDVAVGLLKKALEMYKKLTLSPDLKRKLLKVMKLKLIDHSKSLLPSTPTTDVPASLSVPWYHPVAVGGRFFTWRKLLPKKQILSAVAGYWNDLTGVSLAQAPASSMYTLDPWWFLKLFK